MAIHPHNARRCYECESKNRRYCRPNDAYLNEPPVRDTNPGPSGYEARVLAPLQPMRPPTERDAALNNNTYIPGQVPIPPSVGSPPMGRYDLFDLRFDTQYQRWYWIPTARPDRQNLPPVAYRQSRYTPSPCCEPFRRFCGIRRPDPSQRRPMYSNSYMQSMYRTPSGSDVWLTFPATSGQQLPFTQPSPGFPPPRRSQEMPPCRQACPMGDTEPACKSTMVDSCPPKRSKRKRCKGGGECRVEESSTPSTSSDDCKCEERKPRHCSPKAGCCPRLTNCMNPMFCPCQQMECSCLQNICCSCAQNLQKTMMCEPVKKPAKKKAKCSRCCCTQTMTESKDKAVLTRMVEVSDACVCCKPKKEKKPCKPANKTCYICKRPNLCPARCCPCILPMCAPNNWTCPAVGRCPGNEAECAPPKCENDCAHILECSRKRNCSTPRCENDCTHILECSRKRNCSTPKCENDCAHILECSRKTNCSAPKCENECAHILDCSRKTNCSAPNYCKRRCCDSESSNNLCCKAQDNTNTLCNDTTCPVRNTTANWLTTSTTEKYPFTSNLSWINDMLLKKSLPAIKQKYFHNNDQFSSPLTGNTYNVNMVKIKNRHYKNYAALDPFSTDETIDELRKAVENIKGDPEHRTIVTAVCDALLNNRVNNSFEGGDSSFLDEYTYTNQSDPLPAEQNPFDLPKRNNAPFSGPFKPSFPNHFNTFAQTSFNQLKAIPTANAQTLTVQPNAVNSQLATDPINPYFNEMTQTGVDELFEEYMKKIRHSKLFSRVSDGVQSDNTKIPVETYCQMSDFGVFKDAPSQYDNTSGSTIDNKTYKDNVDDENFQLTIPVYQPKCYEVKDKLAASNITAKRTISNENYNQSDKKDALNQDQVSNKNTVENKNKLKSGVIGTVNSSSSSILKMKRKRSATVSDSAKKAISPKETCNQNVCKSLDRHQSCLNSEDSDTKLSIHCPRNKKSDETDHCISKALTTVNKSPTQIKSATLAQDVNSNKKRKIFFKHASQKPEEEKKYKQSSDILQNLSRFKSRIPIICPDKFKSSNETANNDGHFMKSSDVLKKIETTISNMSFADVKSEELDTGMNKKVRAPELEDLYISNRARGHTFEYTEEQTDEKHSNPHMHYDEVYNYGEEDGSYEDDANYQNAPQQNARTEINQLLRSISNSEILISNIKYDSEESLSVDNDDNEPLDEFTFSSQLENQKSVLSIIKEETESDVNINTAPGRKYLDMNTSPFNFEVNNHNFVDSCNSPFEIRKHKDKKHSGLSCFSSHEESSEPYRAAGGSSTSEEVERPRTARGIRWLFNM